MMEVFVIGHFAGSPNQLWGLINVASDVLFEAFGSEEKFSRVFPSPEIVYGHYRDAGQYQVSLPTSSNACLANLLRHTFVQKAAAALALWVMRKRPTIYGNYHCKQLADAILPAGA
jgi:hypothetical protein